ncbi:ABC transporter ATP-binding protein [uncultured Campylobacter sp.]|uniref:ABC transporter ATP-binding protein n=1 Tax=uncultured Campylobacter sp. TaxID=218934 RepID=UPI00261F0FDF|nr:ATP-binding cassette domain-containing protein [uncultured Campylobacter sp.]
MLIEGKNLVVGYGDKILHESINFHINEAEIYGFLGGSGSGKTTLMKTLIYLKEPLSGKIYMFGKDLWSLNYKEREKIKLKTGVTFQFGALFSSMSVLDNIAIMLREYSSLDSKDIIDIAMFWLDKVGLKEECATLFPSELSGGMKKRVALARALVLSPRVLFLDEPNSGLDPVSSRAMDRLIMSLRDSLGITVVVVTHDEESIFTMLDRFLIIGNKKVLFEGSLDEAKALKSNPLREIV